MVNRPQDKAMKSSYREMNTVFTKAAREQPKKLLQLKLMPVELCQVRPRRLACHGTDN